MGNGQPVIATEEGSTVEIDGEEVSVTFDGTNVIVNGEEVGVSETVAGEAASAVVEGESVEVNGEAVSVIFDGTNAIVNGEVVPASEEGATIVIGAPVHEAKPAAAVVSGEAVADLLTNAIVKDLDQPSQSGSDHLDDALTAYFVWRQIFAGTTD